MVQYIKTNPKSGSCVYYRLLVNVGKVWRFVVLSGSRLGDVVSLSNGGPRRFDEHFDSLKKRIDKGYSRMSCGCAGSQKTSHGFLQPSTPSRTVGSSQSLQ